MKTLLTGLLLWSIFHLQGHTQEVRKEVLFDSGWKFYRGDIQGAEKVKFDDNSWRSIDLPHDWSVEDLDHPVPGKVIGPFSKESPGGTSTGYVMGGTGWYRKIFSLPDERGKIVFLNFDGVYMDCDIWINGKHAGSHPYGYTAFNLDITKFLNAPGSQNVIAVRVRNEGKNSRWYSGSGIYRHVWLISVQPVHVAPWGVFVSTQHVSDRKAMVRVVTNVENSDTKAADVRIRTRILDPEGQAVTSGESASRSISVRPVEISQDIAIASPRLWSLEKPELYTAEIEIITKGTTTDKIKVPFGIRTIHFDATTGFTLNGENILLKGGCMHQDNVVLGSATIDRAEERRVELMKAYGFNAIRTSHNPPSRQFLDACDRIGILVIDEAFDQWERPKNPMDYHRFFRDWWQHDIQSMVMRDRNHPSVIIWSIGNEINERADTSGLLLTKQLSDEVHRLDPTRPVTAALCHFWDHKGRPWSDTAPAFELLDIGGYNYQYLLYDSDHAEFPGRIMMGTESVAKDAFDNWKHVEDDPWVIGDFVWTAMDYMGETGIGNSRLNDNPDSSFTRTWPWFNAYCGDIDLTGFKKPQLFYRDVIWRNSKLEMAVHAPIPEGKREIVSYWGWPEEWQSWNWKGNEGKLMDVRVFTRCPKVRLELNGKIIGEKEVSDSTKLIATFKVPYQPGVLKAVGLEHRIEVVTKTLTTTGAPRQIKLTADRQMIRADRNDLSYVKIEIIDEFGNVIPDASIPVRLLLSGEGEIAGVGNACPDCMASFKKPGVTTFRGAALVILRPVIGNKKGTITLTAEAEGLQAGTITIITH